MMTSQTFHELTEQLEQELNRLHYSDTSIKQYRSMWKRIATFFEQENINFYTEEAGLRFLDEQYHFFELEKAGKLTQSLINIFRIIRMLGDFQQHGSILRRYYKQKELLDINEFAELLKSYQNYCLQKDYSKATQNHYKKITEKFLSFIESQGIIWCTDISPKHISCYINTLLGYSYKTVELELCGIRSFLSYLHENELHPEPLVKAIPAIKARKQNRIPSIWTQENVTKLLDAIDRGNPVGKRDYAIILLVTRLGLRTIDVKHLKLSSLCGKKTVLK